MESVDIGDSIFPKTTISFLQTWYKDAITCGLGVTIQKVDFVQRGTVASITPTNGRLKLTLPLSNSRSRKTSFNLWIQRGEQVLLTFYV